MKKEAEKAKVEMTDSALVETLPTLKVQLKALIARDLWDMKEYFQIYNPTLDIYRKGTEVIESEEYLF